MQVRGSVVVAAAVAVVMVAAILYGWVAGDFTSETDAIVGLAWGRVALIDLYAGLVVIAAWIALRERSWARVIPWWLALVVLGNLATALYVLRAGLQARGDTSVLLLGPGQPN